MSPSTIEWTDETWNPVTGCDRVSPGCDHCYAMTLAKRLKAMGQTHYQRDGDERTSGPGFGVTCHDDEVVDLPKRWRKPRRVFVNSMSDLFHPEVPEEVIIEIFVTMVSCPQHQFQILTKRSQRMAKVLGDPVIQTMIALAMNRGDAYGGNWPPVSNVWLGTSVENQRYADLRIPHLLATPAAVRFLSIEPLLGPVDLDRTYPGTVHSTDWLADLDWVIVGGESGPGARPMHAGWVRAIRDRCVAADVPFFFKQWGGRTPKAGGRDLDGRTWDEMPKETS